MPRSSLSCAILWRCCLLFTPIMSIRGIRRLKTSGSRITIGAGAVKCTPPSRHHLDYSRLARYGDQVERFLEQIGRRNIHISIHEDLKSDVETVYRSIISFLGLGPGGLPNFRRFNPQRRSRSKVIAGLHQRMTARKTTLPLPTSLSGSILRKGEIAVNKVIGRLNAVQVVRPPLDPVMRRGIIADHRDDILKLSDLIDRDLSHWLK